jgi:hypothetical protein
MDEILIPLRAFLHSDYPSDAEVLTQIGQRMTLRDRAPNDSPGRSALKTPNGC